MLAALGTCVLATSYPVAQPSAASIALPALTVSNLDAACNLAPARRVDISRSLPGRGSVNENPWIGSDAGVLASVREIIYGAGPVVDGPPTDRAAFSRYFLRLSEGIDDAYVAF
jgi:hypothetical protein